jgi:hypothetical protein
LVAKKSDKKVMTRESTSEPRIEETKQQNKSVDFELRTGGARKNAESIVKNTDYYVVFFFFFFSGVLLSQNG